MKEKLAENCHFIVEISQYIAMASICNAPKVQVATGES